MAFKQRLLATAAIPFMALAGYSLPAAAAVVRPAAIEAQSPIVTVQSEEEVVPRKKRKQAQEDQQNADQGNAAGEEQMQPRKKKRQQQAEEQNLDQQNADQGNAASEEQLQPRKKKRQQQAEEQNMDQQPVDQGNAATEEQVQPRKKKRQQQAEQQNMDQQNADQGNAVSEEPVQPRKKKNKQAQQADQQNVDQGNGAVSDEDIVNQSKKKKNKQAQTDEQNVDQQNVDQGNAAADDQGQPRKKKNKQAQSDDANTDTNAANGGQVSDEDIVNMSKKNKNKKNAEADTPAVIEKREEVAKDPSKTTDTVVLPVENGAAVLDSDKDADNSGNADSRKKRKQEREQVKNVPVPKSDKDAQKTDVNIVIKPVLEVKGDRIDNFDRYEDPRGRNVGKGNDIRVVFNLDGRVVIRADDRDRIGRNEQIRYEQLRNDRIREIVVRPNGDRIVTVRNRFGEIIRRSRIEADNREIVIFYSPDLDGGRDQLYLRDPGDELPPMRLRVPVEDYIIDVSSNPDRDYEEFLSEPPVERVERVYSVDEVKYSARLRDKVRRIDLDTITFETGSAEISQDQAKSLRKVASAISEILDKDPGETFLIEGHTDAVGSDESNLVLSDERAESIANVLTELFEIPAENLVTQGYGERFLKVDTDQEERMNRRVTIRRISPLVRPVETSEN